MIRLRKVPCFSGVLLIFIRSRRSCVILLCLDARLFLGFIISGFCSVCFVGRASLPFFWRRITVSP